VKSHTKFRPAIGLLDTNGQKTDRQAKYINYISQYFLSLFLLEGGRGAI